MIDKVTKFLDSVTQTLQTYGDKLSDSINNATVSLDNALSDEMTNIASQSNVNNTQVHKKIRLRKD